MAAKRYLTFCYTESEGFEGLDLAYQGSFDTVEEAIAKVPSHPDFRMDVFDIEAEKIRIFDGGTPAKGRNVWTEVAYEEWPDRENVVRFPPDRLFPKK